jgi:RNA polymerase sigma-70 factor (ECF subfamily)
MDSFDVQSELERHHAESFAWALTCCDFDPARAEDLLQVVYLKILRSQAVFRGKSSWKTWLFAVIRRTAADERRRQLLRCALLLKWGECTAHASPPEPPDSVLERAQVVTACRDALRQLSGRQRQVLHLVFYQDLTIEEAAEVMRLSIGSARTHYERAKARLRDLLASTHHYERRGTQSDVCPDIRSR